MSKLRYDRRDIKRWARAHYQGLENCLLPSFNKDLTALDEAAVRHDVRMSVKHGFCKTIVVADAGLTMSELKRMMELAVEEANGRIFVSVWLGLNNRAEMLAALKFGEQIGIDSALMHYPLGESFASEEDIYQFTLRICDSTALAIDLYPSHKYNFERFHPSTFSPELTARMAEIENVAGMKDGTPDLNALVEVFELAGDKLLPQTPIVDFWAVFVTKYGMQWAGSVPFEFFQDTSQRQLVRYFQLLREGRLREALAIYWRLAPVRLTFMRLIVPTVISGMYNYNMWKYMQWLVGGSGGYVRTPCLKLFEHDKMAIRDAMLHSGIELRPEAAPAGVAARADAA